jgi:hypothetical protein
MFEMYVETILQIIAMARYGISLNETFNSDDVRLYNMIRRNFACDKRMTYDFRSIRDKDTKECLTKFVPCLNVFDYHPDISVFELFDVIELAKANETPSGSISDIGVAIWEKLKHMHSEYSEFHFGPFCLNDDTVGLIRQVIREEAA